MKIAFFEIEPWEADYVKERLPGYEVWTSQEKLIKEALPKELDFDAVSVFVGSKVTKEVLDQLLDIRVLTTRSTGFDHIDLTAAKEKGVRVGYVPGYGDNTVAEFAFGLILDLAKKIYWGFDRIRETGTFSFDGLQGFDLKGKTIGIVGTGRIGMYMVKIAHGFDMKILATDPMPRPELAAQYGFKYVPLDELLSSSDIISIHVPYLETTHHLINAGNISKIKKGALLVNTSRGAVVETDALVKALHEGILGGAGLDVLEEEGAIQDEKALVLYGHPEEHNLKIILENHVLIDMPNVIITPHNAFNTKEALQRILDMDLENINSFFDKKDVKYPVPGN